jgi:molybdopterin-binding protein
MCSFVSVTWSGALILWTNQDWNQMEEIMKLSARNLIPGTVKEVTIGMVNAEVVIEIAPGVEMVSVITKNSVERMGIKVGEKVDAMVKATSVMIAKD